MAAETKEDGGMTWQPIDTAPTAHGAEMLVWEPRDASVYMAKRFNDRHGKELRLVKHYDDISTMSRCTHWMPIPEPPR